jgi:hypothetical protein
MTKAFIGFIVAIAHDLTMALTMVPCRSSRTGGF